MVDTGPFSCDLKENVNKRRKASIGTIFIMSRGIYTAKIQYLSIMKVGRSLSE
jgi:hypothetical protein